MAWILRHSRESLRGTRRGNDGPALILYDSGLFGSYLSAARMLTMSLAQRVRDYRYSKGWGPDELASRAAISRTALYQIESGKTELPRAGTLRRIAMALDVSMETLLGHGDGAGGTSAAGRR